MNANIEPDRTPERLMKEWMEEEARRLVRKKKPPWNLPECRGLKGSGARRALTAICWQNTAICRHQMQRVHGKWSAARSVNSIMTAAYWLIGHRVMEFEQSGKKRAEYGTALIERLTADMSKRFGVAQSNIEIASRSDSLMPGISLLPMFRGAFCGSSNGFARGISAITRSMGSR